MTFEHSTLVNLWRRVLIQAFIDALYTGRRYDRLTEREEAVNFLTKPSESLNEICSICDYSQENIITAARQLINSGYGIGGDFGAKRAQIIRIKERLKKLAH